MSKNLENDTIDLLDLSFIILEKVSGFNFCFGGVLIAFTSETIQNKRPLVIEAKTEIRPISVYEEDKYAIYNLTIKQLNTVIVDDIKNKESTDLNNQKKSRNKFFTSLGVGNLKINNIDRKFLLNLFIDYISQEKNIIFLVKKFNYLKKEDYSNLEEYENAVKSLSSINILKDNKTKKYYVQQVNIEEDIGKI